MQENIFATLEWDIPKQDMKLRAITIQSGYIKSKTFCLTKDTTNKVKFQLRGKIIGKGLIFNVNNSYKLVRKTNTPIEK